MNSISCKENRVTEAGLLNVFEFSLSVTGLLGKELYIGAYKNNLLKVEKNIMKSNVFGNFKGIFCIF